MRFQVFKARFFTNSISRPQVSARYPLAPSPSQLSLRSARNFAIDMGSKIMLGKAMDAKGMQLFASEMFGLGPHEVRSVLDIVSRFAREHGFLKYGNVEDTINSLKGAEGEDVMPELLGQFDPGDLQVLREILPRLEGFLAGELDGPEGKNVSGEVCGELSLRFDRLSNLPDEIAGLESLQCLNITNNQFISLPACIGYLPALKSLNASYNQLESLLPSLTLQLHGELNLANNRLQDLPDSLVASPIAQLCLARNLFRHVPPEVKLMPYLYYLDLQGNPLENLEGLPGSKINIGVSMEWWNDPILKNYYPFSGRDRCPLCVGTEELDIAPSH